MTTVTDETELNQAIAAIDGTTVAGTYTIDIAGTIFEGTDTSAGLPPDLYAINLHPGVSLVIDGGGTGTLDGGDIYRGFLVYAGDVTIENLTIAHAAALGGSGVGGGGGGAGLGGGLFVAGPLNGSLGSLGGEVTLDNVAFNADLAVGGAGGSGFNAGGGGGLGGDGGTGNNGDAGGGGGGIGAAAFGGTPNGQSALPGIVAGANGGGAGGEGAPGVGGSAGGGGGGGATTDDGFTFYAGGGGGVGGLAGNGNAHGGAGGFGGGGGGASGENLGGTGGGGGFGGGGGAGSQGGDGGFGGGGGFGSTAGGSGAGGFGAGGGSDQDGGPQGGGGGLGAGGDIFVQQGGVLLIEGGSLTSGVVQGGAAGGNGGVGAAYGDGVFIQGYQAITLAPRAGETLTIGATIADQTGSDPTATSQGQGGLIVQGPGTVVLDGFNTFTDGTTIENGGRLDLAAPLAAAGTGPITFSGSGEVLRIEAVALPDGSFTNAIRDFSGAATIDLAGMAYVPGETSAILDATELIVSNGTLTDRLFLEGTFPAALHVSSDGTGGTDVTCFVRGTRIATPGGEVPVETLGQGDPVTTVSGATRPVVWIGRRRIDPRRHPDAGRVRPIRIRRDAFGAGVPHRDLLVSPDHAVFIDGALVCARRLINGATILQDAGDVPVEYFHLELASHDILLAEGLPSESYLDTGNRALFENAGLPVVLHPDLSGQARRVAGSCAPFVEADAAVYEIWRRLAARAAALGVPVGLPETTTDPALRVVVGGRVIGPLSYAAGRAVFLLPDAGPARLVSRAAMPAALRPWSEDRRRLGVSVSRILRRRGDAVTEQPLDDPRLADGWWEVERDGPVPRRWTSGDAVLPAPVRAGPALLEVQYGAGLYGEPVELRRRLAA